MYKYIVDIENLLLNFDTSKLKDLIFLIPIDDNVSFENIDLEFVYCNI